MMGKNIPPVFEKSQKKNKIHVMTYIRKVRNALFYRELRTENKIENFFFLLTRYLTN